MTLLVIEDGSTAEMKAQMTKAPQTTAGVRRDAHMFVIGTQEFQDGETNSKVRDGYRIEVMKLARSTWKASIYTVWPRGGEMPRLFRTPPYPCPVSVVELLTDQVGTGGAIEYCADRWSGHGVVVGFVESILRFRCNLSSSPIAHSRLTASLH